MSRKIYKATAEKYSLFPVDNVRRLRSWLLDGDNAGNNKNIATHRTHIHRGRKHGKIADMKDFKQERLAAAFAEHRQRLFALAEKRLNPILLKRLSAEDVLSEAYVNAVKRPEYFAAHDDVPVYFKLRTILVQTICDIERRHLKAQGRDAYKELRVVSLEFGVEGDDGKKIGDDCMGELPADITSPVSHVDRNERHALLRSALAGMPESDRAILVMRHFDGMGNSECAAALGLTEKAASIRYVRALERLEKKLVEISCFRKS